MEDMARTNAIQYMLMVYLDENRWARMSEAQKGAVIQGYGEIRHGIGALNSALLERP